MKFTNLSNRLTAEDIIARAERKQSEWDFIRLVGATVVLAVAAFLMFSFR